MFQLEVAQFSKHATTGNPQVTVGKFSVLTLGACEVLISKKGPTPITQGLFKLRDLFKELSASPLGERASYEESVVTSLCRDIFGGNSLTTGIFCMQMGDPVGSQVTLDTMDLCRNINTFPVQNSNLVLGLLRKSRNDLQSVRQQLFLLKKLGND